MVLRLCSVRAGRLHRGGRGPQLSHRLSGRPLRPQDQRGVQRQQPDGGEVPLRGLQLRLRRRQHDARRHRERVRHESGLGPPGPVRPESERLPGSHVRRLRRHGQRAVGDGQRGCALRGLLAGGRRSDTVQRQSGIPVSMDARPRPVGHQALPPRRRPVERRPRLQVRHLVRDRHRRHPHRRRTQRRLLLPLRVLPGLRVLLPGHGAALPLRRRHPVRVGVHRRFVAGELEPDSERRRALRQAQRRDSGLSEAEPGLERDFRHHSGGEGRSRLVADLAADRHGVPDRRPAGLPRLLRQVLRRGRDRQLVRAAAGSARLHHRIRTLA